MGPGMIAHDSLLEQGRVAMLELKELSDVGAQRIVGVFDH
jgi:hypothetical protein